MVARHYRRGGDGDGSDWDQAKPYGAFRNDLRLASPNDSFLIGFNRGREDPIFWKATQGELSVSGTEGEPIRIHFGYMAQSEGVATPSGRYLPAAFRQSDARFADLNDPNLAGDPFLVLRDTSYLDLCGPVFSHCSPTGFYRFEGSGPDAPIANVSIADVHATMAGRVIETTDETYIDGMTVENCTAAGLVRGFARFSHLSNSVLRNLVLDAAQVDAGGKSVCQIIAVTQGQGIAFENIVMRNAHNGISTDERGSEYVQGDGIVCEEDTSDITITDCHAKNMGDGGFDLKTMGVQLRGCSAENCKLGVRIWRRSEDNLAHNCIIASPRNRGPNQGACIWCAGMILVTYSILRAGIGTSIFRFGSGPDGGRPEVTVRGGRIDYPAGAYLVRGEPGTIRLEDVAINGERITALAEWDGQNLTMQ